MVTHAKVVVIGAGASGLGAAIRLKQQGITDFVVLEKAAELGGTWRDNTYPGCACDVPSALYSYSFAPNPEWTRAYAGQAEIQRYLLSVADRYGVRDKIDFGTELRAARWDEDAQLWRLETSAGDYTAQAVISACGPWHEPKIPDIDGLREFEGEVFHSSRWNHDYDLTGKRVAVVGTGASAVQFVPEIQKEVGSLHLFQRTPQWVLPKPDHYVPRIKRWVMRNIPGAQKALRLTEYGGMEFLGIGFRHPWLLRVVQQIGRLHLRLTVRDARLRRILTPDYTLGCKRILMSNNYFRSLTRSNVEVLPTAVQRIGKNSVIGADGTEREVDAIILGTGFHITDQPIAQHVFDADGVQLADRWNGRPEAYLGSSVSGFPNLFLVLGPNLGTGHTSAFQVIEAQVNYAVGGVKAILDGGWSSVDVRPEVQKAFNQRVQRDLQSTVYNAGGCASYYLNDDGTNSFSWPWSSGEITRRLQFSPSPYRILKDADREVSPTRSA
ncbi:NAD(P)/FAD-dependent oxidoreductase [Pseudonocardiaceae bacterium YIM PH 21723]|nr:NAD(P)/FAD-dependent oxidoreductase [Pseudonocardiaceae bacterium YIM PH 21723]